MIRCSSQCEAVGIRPRLRAIRQISLILVKKPTPYSRPLSVRKNSERMMGRLNAATVIRQSFKATPPLRLVLPKRLPARSRWVMISTRRAHHAGPAALFQAFEDPNVVVARVVPVVAMAHVLDEIADDGLDVVVRMETQHVSGSLD